MKGKIRNCLIDEKLSPFCANYIVKKGKEIAKNIDNNREELWIEP